MKVKLISCKTPTAEHYKVSVVQTAQLIIQMWRISEGDLLSFTADFQGIIHNRAVIRKLWQTQRTGTSAYLPQGFVQDLIIKQLGLSSESKRSHTLQGKSSPINFMVFYHINPERILDSCILIAYCCKKMTGIPLMPGTTCSNLGSQNYYPALSTVTNVVLAASVWGFWEAIMSLYSRHS